MAVSDIASGANGIGDFRSNVHGRATADSDDFGSAPARLGRAATYVLFEPERAPRARIFFHRVVREIPSAFAAGMISPCVRARARSIWRRSASCRLAAR